MAHHGYQINGHGGGIDPSDLSMPNNFQSSFQNNNTNNGYPSHSNPSNAYAASSAIFGDDELLDSLASPTEPQAGMHGHGQDFGLNDMGGMAFSQGVYGSHHGLPIDHHAAGFSSTPDGDPIQSPFVHNFGLHRQIQHPQSFGGSLQSPLSYTGADLNDGDANFLKARPRMPQSMQRKPSANRGPLTPKAGTMAGLSLGSESPFGSQPIRTGGAHHEKSHSGQWAASNSISSFPGSGFSSPLSTGLHSAQINEMLLKGGASMPAKIGTPGTAVNSQEAKKKRRRESHNLVERRRRDNINERIQDLSKLVPSHRLEDEKVKKALQASGGTVSPDLTGLSNSAQATSTLAGPGARRAAGGTAGNITTGLPQDDKDKGPNKGDILNGAVYWMRDLMWLVKNLMHQQEELLSAVHECGGKIPFEITDEQLRMQSEIRDAMERTEEFAYSRFDGSGLRVPEFTDIAGKRVNNQNVHGYDQSISPANNGGLGYDMLDAEDFIGNQDDDDEINFKEEDEYGMDMT
ncbi:microphthalmia-associated transcription factor [Podospora australis]|uniref:Microphthalmia-associated transcription factor n=1 Tax=Podospora australis TaxID=1536484 RepID=A0AAN6X7B0_9PEZI|nr:microphthalmia-associated transcription factor [Podospora australis]